MRTVPARVILLKIDYEYCTGERVIILYRNGFEMYIRQPVVQRESRVCALVNPKLESERIYNTGIYVIYVL